MANTTGRKRKHKGSQKNMHERTKAMLKKVKPKNHMTKKEYRRWKNKMKRLGVA